MTRRVVFPILLLTMVFGLKATANQTPSITGSSVKYTGVNLASAEFNPDSLPGKYNLDYVYPSQADADYFLDKGMNVIRLPFLWERLQSKQFGSLSTDELSRIDNVVNYVTKRGSVVILDPHNYARYRGKIVGKDISANAFANFWQKLASRYKNNNRVIFGLMNEPNNMSTEVWRDAANKAIAAIRSTGATNLILVPGNAWTGAHSWEQSWYGQSNAEAMLGIKDPGNNYAFEVHQYLDADFSGTSDKCVSETIGSQKLKSFTEWLRKNGKRGFLGEFGGGRNSTCYAAIDQMLNYINSNTDVWLGWTYWAAGPWWGDYMYTLEPNDDGKDRPQMGLLSKHLTQSAIVAQNK